MAKLVKRVGNSINVSEMRDGQVAVITNWTVGSYIGSIVQRYDDHLVSIGESVAHAWVSFFDTDTEHFGCEVEVLRRGTQIEL